MQPQSYVGDTATWLALVNTDPLLDRARYGSLSARLHVSKAGHRDCRAPIDPKLRNGSSLAGRSAADVWNRDTRLGKIIRDDVGDTRTELLPWAEPHSFVQRLFRAAGVYDVGAKKAAPIPLNF